MASRAAARYPNAVDISPNRDRKLFKEILREGEVDGEFPGPGLEVFVYYVGTLEDGTEFDRSDRELPPFNFHLGRGAVIKGWDEGVKTMKIGEYARFIIAPEFGYGPSGNGKIPPNSTLIFKVELVNWKEEDLTKQRDEGIMRRKIVAGHNQYMTPMDGASVTINIKGSHLGRVFDERQQVTFILGDGNLRDVPYGVEKSLKHFEEREKSILTLAPEYGWGKEGRAEFEIPPKATLVYEVELTSFEKLREPWELNPKEKLEICRKFKEKGTHFFKRGRVLLARKQYKLIEEYLKTETFFDDKEEARKDLLLAGYLNQAICYIKMNEYQLAISCCDEALIFAPDNTKALYRRGLAYLEVNDPFRAKQDFEAVLEADPENKAVLPHLSVCEKRIRVDLDKEKVMCGRMFGS